MCTTGTHCILTAWNALTGVQPLTNLCHILNTFHHKEVLLPGNYAASYAHAPATPVALQAPLLYSKSVQQYEQKIITDKNKGD